MANEGKIKCRWCGEWFEESDMKIEKFLGPLCEWCIGGLKSHGERLLLEDFSEEAYDEWDKRSRNRRRNYGKDME